MAVVVPLPSLGWSWLPGLWLCRWGNRGRTSWISLACCLLWEPPVPELRGSSADGPLGRLPAPCSAPHCHSKALFSESFSLLLSHYPGKMVTLAVQSVFTMETSWKGGHAAPRSSQVRLCIPSLRRWLWSSFRAPWHGWAVPRPAGLLTAMPRAGAPCAHPVWCRAVPGGSGCCRCPPGQQNLPRSWCPSGANLKDTEEPMLELQSRAVWPGHRDKDALWATCWSHMCATSIPGTGLVTQGGTTAPVGVCARLMVEHGAHRSQPGTAGPWRSPVTGSAGSATTFRLLPPQQRRLLGQAPGRIVMWQLQLAAGPAGDGQLRCGHLRCHRGHRVLCHPTGYCTAGVGWQVLEFGLCQRMRCPASAAMFLPHAPRAPLGALSPDLLVSSQTAPPLVSSPGPPRWLSWPFPSRGSSPSSSSCWPVCAARRGTLASR